ncbi:ATP-binding protein [Piscinibacter sakaiensis]|uniref:ATP-binding protein n=1 Tax=Piscinibacter sakaiensis TaxID=1547922 RepID=UPI003AB01788
MTSTPSWASGDSSPQLAVHLLGRFAASVDGSELPAERWPSLRATHLVQLLSLQPLRRMTRDQIIDALWPKLDPDAGAANLRKALHHARQALGRHDAIVAQRGEIELWPGRPVAVDAELFERQADAALARRDSAECAEAARAYPGLLLPGSQYEPWTEAARERLHARLVELLRISAQWEKLVRLEPTDEPAHRALMQRELEAGNRAAAIRWYGSLRGALQQTLGVAPDPQTDLLYERCLADLRDDTPTFVGRAAPLAKVLSWLGAAPEQRTGGVALLGPGGIGKTALCREIGVQLRAQHWKVLHIEVARTGLAYAAIAAIAETLLLIDRGLLDRIGPGARNVLALLNPLAAPADPLPGPLGRHQVVGAIRRLLMAYAGGADLLLQVDDVHLADDADVDVLLQVAAAGAPVCVLFAARPPASGTTLARGIARQHRAGGLQLLDLEPLDDDECRRLVLRSTTVPLEPAIVERVLRAAEGNPFAAIEMTRCAASASGQGLPASVADAILERLCDVPDEALTLLKWLALCGDRFNVATVEAVAACTNAAPMAALDACLMAGVLVPSGVFYRFRHDLVREMLVEHLAPHHRVTMHREMARLLAEQDAPPAEVARHWLAAGGGRDAAPWLLAAARDAVRLAAFSDSLRHLEQLLDIDPGDLQGLRLRAEALDAIGDPAALAAYRTAAAAADAAGQPGSHDLLAKAALAQVKQGDPKGALVLLQGLQPTSVEGRLCEALAFSGAAALGATDPAMGTEKAAIARRLALQTGDTASIVVASWAQAAAAHARGELRESVWADLHETSAMPQLAVRVFDGHLCITQRFLYGARPYADVIAFAESLATEARRLGAARGHAFGTTLRGEAEWLAGDLAAARQHLREGARLHHAIGGAVGEALSLQRLSELSHFEGRRTDARALLDEALDLARQTDIGFHLLDRIYGTRIAQRADDRDAALQAMHDAEASVRGPLETCPGCRITFAVPAAIAAARAGEVEIAERHEKQCAYLADVVMRLPAWHAAHDEVRAHLGIARQSDPNETIALFTEAAGRFRAAGHPIDAARCEKLAANPA